MSSYHAQGQIYLLTSTNADVCRDLLSGLMLSGLVTKILHVFCMSPMSDIHLFHSIFLNPLTLTIFAIQ